MHSIRLIASSLAVLLPAAVVAQTYTSCNPTTNSSCPSDPGNTASSFSTDFTTSSSLPTGWDVIASESLMSYGSDGATFTVKASGDAPTIQTDFYVLFGVISVFIKSASGTGIVSSVVLESDDLDEIDLEWIGGNSSAVQTNYFGKGNTTVYDRAIWVPVSETQTTSHNYTVNWQSDKTEWFVDGALVRTLNYADAVGGNNYPQTPMRVKIGIWAGGDTTLDSAGTIAWAGGDTNYSQGPFSMSLQSVQITNSNPGSSYTYGDTSGSYQSIKIGSGSSTSAGSSSSGTDTGKSSSNSTTTASGSTSKSSSVSVASNSTSSSSGSKTSSSAAAQVSTAGAPGSVDSNLGFLVSVVAAMAAVLSVCH